MASGYKIGQYKSKQLLPSFTPNYELVLEKAMAPHSITLAWKILWMEEPGRLRVHGVARSRI